MTVELLLLAAKKGAGAHPSALLDPHGFGLVFWTAIIFAITSVILYKTAWGPILQALEDREDAIAGSIERAEQAQREGEAMKRRYEDQLEDVRQEAQAILDEGEADKQKIISTAHAKATKDAAEIRARAERDIVLAKNKALAEVRKESVSLGMAIAEKVLVAEIDQGKHQTIINEVLSTYEGK